LKNIAEISKRFEVKILKRRKYYDIIFNIYYDLERI